jgi:hypothetical protein
MINWKGNGKGKGNGSGVTNVLSGNLHRGAEENHETFQWG